MDSSAIFVFGSNEAGIHGAGAAKVALKFHGAIYCRGEGHHGKSYAIPTRNRRLVTLPLPKIREYVERFLKYASLHGDLQFQVTAIGTGYAGLRHEDMAPMFASAPDNCWFDTVWEPWLPGKKFWGTY